MKDKTTVYGVHSLTKLLTHSPQQIIEIFIIKDRIKDNRCQQVLQLAQQSMISIQQVNKDTLDKWCPGANHQGIVAWIKTPEPLSEEQLFGLIAKTKDPLLLVLDGIQDPHNLGAILRTADAARVTAVIIPKDKSVPITPAVRKVASGAAETVPLASVKNLSRTLKEIQELGIWTVGLACTEEATSLYSVDLTGPRALILGGEADGLRALTLKHCDYVASIPMLGTIESLNVSVATGVCLFEAIRQRVKK